jgi:hypothetical protein
MNNYWIKDQSRREIITKTQIPNKGKFKIYANYYNLIDLKGLGFVYETNFKVELEQLYNNGNFQYYVIEDKKLKYLYILPNKNINQYINQIMSKIDDCKNEDEVINLLIDEMLK